jgi:hypothetical protein
MPPKRAKQRRTTQACDFCHARGTRCRVDDSGANRDLHSCTTCLDYGEACRWTRALKKRGTKPGTTGQVKSWKERVVRDRQSINALLNVHLDTVHLVFPLYCERELWIGWRDSTFPASLTQYASLVCMCALSAQHIEQGSLFESQRPLNNSAMSAKSLLSEARNLLNVVGPVEFDLEYVRACGFIALLGLQSGDYNLLHKHLAAYHGACAQFHLHDESQWGMPLKLNICELEMRRRLYWAMYRLEVHSACVLGHMVRSPEAQSNVDYPVGLHHPAFVSGRDGNFEDWFAGWNTTTDLYRILEHTVIEFRARRRQRESAGPRRCYDENATARQRLSDIQQRALPQFQKAYEKSSDSGRNRCGFQTTNILFTIHLIRMFTIDPTPQNMYDAADALLASVKQIPAEYIRANGRRLLEEVAGTALMLGTIANRTSTSLEETQSLLALQEALVSFIETCTSANGTAAALLDRLRRQMAEKCRFPDDTDSRVEGGTVSAVPLPKKASENQWWELLDVDHLMSETNIFNSYLRPGLIVDTTWPQ